MTRAHQLQTTLRLPKNIKPANALARLDTLAEACDLPALNYGDVVDGSCGDLSQSHCGRSL
jgi:hypothetical protein